MIVLYTLNLYSAVCQLYLNKTERKNSPVKDKIIPILQVIFQKKGKIGKKYFRTHFIMP